MPEHLQLGTSQSSMFRLHLQNSSAYAYPLILEWPKEIGLDMPVVTLLQQYTVCWSAVKTVKPWHVFSVNCCALVMAVMIVSGWAGGISINGRYTALVLGCVAFPGLRHKCVSYPLNSGQLSHCTTSVKNPMSHSLALCQYLIMYYEIIQILLKIGYFAWLPFCLLSAILNMQISKK